MFISEQFADITDKLHLVELYHLYSSARRQGIEPQPFS